MSRIGTALRLARANPRLLAGKMLGKLARFAPVPHGVVRKRVNGVVFRFDFDLDPRVREMYLGYHQLEVVELMRRFLHRGGVFVDVGASVGYLAALALGWVGRSGQVHSFEPVPQYFCRLKEIGEDNPGYRFFASPCALGDRPGRARIVVGPSGNIGWNTMVPGFMDCESMAECVEVEVVRLDAYLQAHKVEHVSLIKIDAEGYEFPILRGLETFFHSTAVKPPILAEVAPAAYPLLGAAVSDLGHYLERFGYRAYSVVDCRTPVDLSALAGTSDVVFLTLPR